MAKADWHSKSGPVKVLVMVGGTTHMGSGVVLGRDKPKAGKRGTLDDLVLNKKTAAAFEHLVDEDGMWVTRSDVWPQFDRRGLKSGAHGILFGGDRKRGIGPEFGRGLLQVDAVHSQPSQCA